MSATPGTWRIVKADAGCYIEADGPDGERVDIARVWWADLDEGADNARLIAAAPGLLAAAHMAQAVLDTFASLAGTFDPDTFNEGGDGYAGWMMLREAIAVAEGWLPGS